MKIKLSGSMTIEQFSERMQMALAQLQEMGINQVDRCNLYLTPVDKQGNEVNAWGEGDIPIKEIEITTEIKEDPTKLTILKK